MHCQPSFRLTGIQRTRVPCIRPLGVSGTTFRFRAPPMGMLISTPSSDRTLPTWRRPLYHNTIPLPRAGLQASSGDSSASTDSTADWCRFASHSAHCKVSACAVVAWGQARSTHSLPSDPILRRCCCCSLHGDTSRTGTEATLLHGGYILVSLCCVLKRMLAAVLLRCFHFSLPRLQLESVAYSIALMLGLKRKASSEHIHAL